MEIINMSETPPPSAYESMSPPQPSAQRVNGLAIASLVCGIICCVPFLTNLAAVVLGTLAIRKTRDQKVGGKSLAIVGVTLGMVGLVGWTIWSGMLLGAYIASMPAREVAHQFALDLSNGNTAAAVAASEGFTSEQLTKAAIKMQPWGTLTDTSFGTFNIKMNLDTGTTCELSGVAKFTNGGEKTYTVILVKRGEVFKVGGFNLK